MSRQNLLVDRGGAHPRHAIRFPRKGAFGLPGIAFAAFLLTGGLSPAGTPTMKLEELPMEDLLNLEVTSVAKKETKLSESPAAVAVLTRDDIQRLGATTIPEALRAVPGLQVARIDANKWAVSARGLNDEYSNKLLVLVDGRSVYTPTFGGVYWDQQDLVLEDLDRIEVIRGPGATLWGANAVNGVINIITRSARETQGLLVSSSYGTEDHPSASVRYGGQLSSNLFYRVYAKYFNREGFEDAQGNSMGDDWNMARGGVRLDWEPDEANTFTLIGEYSSGTYGEQVGKSVVYPTPEFRVMNLDAPTSGGNVLGRWQRVFSPDSDLKLQVYYDHYQRKHPFGGGALVAAPDEFAESQNLMSERRDTVDVDLQHRIKLGSRNDVVWGAGYRHTEDRIDPGGVEIFWAPDAEEDDLFSTFVQDEISVVEDRLRVTLGSKFEHNDHTGWEVQPGVRLLWTPTERQSYWASVARAVRTPTRLERSARVNILSGVALDSTPYLVSSLPSANADSEDLLAYEIGCRFEPMRRVSFDVAAFYNDYELLSAVPTGYIPELDPPVPHVVQSYSYTNGIDGHTYGVELLVNWQPTDWWRITAGYNWLRASIEDGLFLSKTSPEHQFHLRSSVDLGRGVEFNAAAWYVGEIQSLPMGATTTEIPSYVRLDLGLIWRLGSHVELSVWGQNLLDNGHPEFASYKTPNIAEIPRTFYGQVTLRF